MLASNLLSQFKTNTSNENCQPKCMLADVIEYDLKNNFYTLQELQTSILNVGELENSLLFGSRTRAGKSLIDFQYHLQQILWTSPDDEIDYLADYGSFDFVDTPIADSFKVINGTNGERIHGEVLVKHMFSLPPNNSVTGADVMDFAISISEETELGRYVKQLAIDLEAYRTKCQPEIAYDNLKLYTPDYYTEHYAEYTNQKYGTTRTHMDMLAKNGSSYFTYLLNKEYEEVSDEDMEECISELYCMSPGNYVSCSWLHKTLFFVRGNNSFRRSQLFLILETIRYIFLSFILSNIQMPAERGLEPVPMWSRKSKDGYSTKGTFQPWNSRIRNMQHFESEKQAAGSWCVVS